MTPTDLQSTLATLQDDIVHINEELLRDCGPEARTRLRELLARVPAQADVLGADFATRLHAQLEPVLLMLRGNRAAAGATLVEIRRGLRNVQRRLEGLQDSFPYGRELGWPGEAALAPRAH